MATLTRRNAIVELADGRILTVRIINPDTLRYEQTAQLNKWPGMTMIDGVATIADTVRRMTFETWAALKRTNQYDRDFDAFAGGDCVDVEMSEEEVNPTQPEAEPDSSPSLPGMDANPFQS